MPKHKHLAVANDYEIRDNPGVPLPRRTFLGWLASLLPLTALAVSQQPAQATRYRRYPIGEMVIAVDDTKWDSAKGYRVSLWDGDRFVKSVAPTELGRAILVPSWSPDGSIVYTEFTYTGRDASGVASIAAQYTSGPKWWTA